MTITRKYMLPFICIIIGSVYVWVLTCARYLQDSLIKDMRAVKEKT